MATEQTKKVMEAENISVHNPYVAVLASSNSSFFEGQVYNQTFIETPASLQVLHVRRSIIF